MDSALPTIVVLNDYCYVNGGASKVAVDEAVSLAAMGQRVIFVGAVGPVCPQLASADLTVICLDRTELLQAGGNPGVMLQGLWNRTAQLRVRDILKPLNPASTIVHLHGYTKALTTSPVRAASLMGFRIVCTLHDFFPACPNGAFFDYQERKPCLRTAMSLDCITTNCDKRHYAHKVYRVARSAVQRGPGRFPRGVTNYITLSQGSAELLKLYLPAKSRYFALENIIEVPQVPPVDTAANSAIVAVGRLDIEKGIEVLIEACRKVDLSLTLVGDGPAEAGGGNLCEVPHHRLGRAGAGADGTGTGTLSRLSQHLVRDLRAGRPPRPQPAACPPSSATSLPRRSA